MLTNSLAAQAMYVEGMWAYMIRELEGGCPTNMTEEADGRKDEQG